MGAQRVLQAAGVALLLCGVAEAAPKERIAVVDLGPDDGATREVRAQIVASGFEAVIGNGIEDALAGKNVDTDTLELAAAIAEAQRAFGALDCGAAVTASEKAIAIAAMRQAAGLPVPELPRALTYVLLCRDKAGDVDGAMTAARRLRTVGGSKEVPAPLWKKYPDVDAILDDTVSLRIEADVAGATVYVDFEPRGKAPVDVRLRAGEHFIAVAAGTRRGWGAGHTDPKQTTVKIPTKDVAGTGSAIAARVAGWKGAKPAPAELAWVMTETRARLVFVRSGDTLEAWGRVGRSETPRLLGGEDGVAKTTDKQDVTRLLALVADRVQGWNDRAPDPDQPLLVEKPGEGRFVRKEDEPAQWWVYAALGGAIAGVAAILYLNEADEDRQRVELTFP